ncbi:hypothetical protein JCM10213_008031 [Rhodosporidiobolus nylandii]
MSTSSSTSPPSVKHTLSLLTSLFTPSPPSSTSHSTSHPPSNPFPAFRLPPSLTALLDSHLSHFASLPPSTSSTTTSPASPSTSSPLATARTQWRASLLSLWALASPAPGTERDLSSIARVSAFVELLHKLSAEAGGMDEDAAIVPRGDVGGVWWEKVLRRAVLGTSQGGGGEGEGGGKEKGGEKERGRKATRTAASGKGKESTPASPAAAAAAPEGHDLPLYLSRPALASALQIVIWGMLPSSSPSPSSSSSAASSSPFAAQILREYLSRSAARLEGDAACDGHGYGVRNLEECLVGWGEREPAAFFTSLAPSLSLVPSSPSPSPSLLPTISLLLHFLTRHSTKSSHALSTPLLPALLAVGLTTRLTAVLKLVVKCLVIVVVTLPVIVGEERVRDVFAVWGRVVSWDEDEEGEGEEKGEDALETEGPSAATSPLAASALELFTPLYGIYPVNFLAFLRDAGGWLREKGWVPPSGSGAAELRSGVVRERSQPLLTLHTLHPSLLLASPSSASTSELTDPTRWAALEAADVMAACDRLLVPQVAGGGAGVDWRGVPLRQEQGEAEAEGEQEGGQERDGEGEQEVSRSVLFEPGSSDLPPVSPLPHPGEDGTPSSSSPSSPLDSSAPTPKSPTPPPPPPPHARPSASPPSSRAVSRARSPASSTASPARSHGSSTPHMPATTHYTNFQALQLQLQGSPGSGGGSSRDGSRFRSPVSLTSTEGQWMLDHPGVPPSLRGSVSMSRRSSAAGVAHGLLSPDLVPLRSSSASTTSTSHPLSASHPPSAALPPSASASAAHLAARIVRLETDLVVLQGEVAFQLYLKGLHLQHMGTVHREKVLESGAEAERQSSFRTIRTLRASLRATQSALDQSRAEQAATKANWMAHIGDLREKLQALREQRVGWEQRERRVRAELEEVREREAERAREVEVGGREFLDLKNQVALDSAKLDKIGEYEHRIQALTKTLAICDADLVKFADQRREMTLLAGEWKKSELLRESLEEEVRGLREQLRTAQDTLIALQRSTALAQETAAAEALLTNGTGMGGGSKDELGRMRAEMDRLRRRNLELEERLADVLEEGE